MKVIWIVLLIAALVLYVVIAWQVDVELGLFIFCVVFAFVDRMSLQCRWTLVVPLGAALPPQRWGLSEQGAEVDQFLAIILSLFLMWGLL
jgi:hypothetical protein